MSKLGDKERKKLRRTAFELHLQDDQLIAVGHVATNAWWGWGGLELPTKRLSVASSEQLVATCFHARTGNPATSGTSLATKSLQAGPLLNIQS